MVLLWTILTASACAQQTPVATEQLYPYRDREGRFGYVDQNFHTRIQPQYKTASLFTKHGFAVVTDSLDRQGVINRDNKVIIEAGYNSTPIHSFELDNFTLAEVRKTDYSRFLRQPHKVVAFL